MEKALIEKQLDLQKIAKKNPIENISSLDNFRSVHLNIETKEKTNDLKALEEIAEILKDFRKFFIQDKTISKASYEEDLKNDREFYVAKAIKEKNDPSLYQILLEAPEIIKRQLQQDELKKFIQDGTITPSEREKLNSLNMQSAKREKQIVKIIFRNIDNPEFLEKFWTLYEESFKQCEALNDIADENYRLKIMSAHKIGILSTVGLIDFLSKMGFEVRESTPEEDAKHKIDLIAYDDKDEKKIYLFQIKGKLLSNLTNKAEIMNNIIQFLSLDYTPTEPTEIKNFKRGIHLSAKKLIEMGAKIIPVMVEWPIAEKGAIAKSYRNIDPNNGKVLNELFEFVKTKFLKEAKTIDKN